MAQGLMQGFIQGYGLVAGIQNDKRRNELLEQRNADDKAYRDDALGLRREALDYDRSRDEVADERWQTEFDAGRDDAEAARTLDERRLGISAMNARTSARSTAVAARSNDLRAQQQEIEIAQARRAEREEARRRTLTAAAQELQTNGATQRFRSLAKQGDIPIDQFDSPSFRKAKETVIAGLSGAPVEHTKMVDSVGTIFQHRIDRVVGTQTQDGREIVRAQLGDYIPSEDGASVMLDLKIWARDDKGNIEEYDAPVTSNRSAADEYVLQVPVEEAVGYVKGLDVLDQVVPREQLQGLIKQEFTLAGGSDTDSESYWVRGPGSTLFNRSTGETREVPTISDDKKRYAEAIKYARDDFEEDRGFARLPDDDKQRRLIERRNLYLDMMSPEESIDDPDEAVIHRLREEGGSFIAPGGQYAGREVRLKDDGTVVVR